MARPSIERTLPLPIGPGRMARAGRSTLLRITLRHPEGMAGLLASRERALAFTRWRAALEARLQPHQGILLRHAETHTLVRFAGNDLDRGNHAVRAAVAALDLIGLPGQLRHDLAEAFDGRSGEDFAIGLMLRSCHDDGPGGEPTAEALEAAADDLAQSEHRAAEAGWSVGLDPDSLRITGERFLTGRAFSFRLAQDAIERTLIELTGHELTAGASLDRLTDAARVREAIADNGRRTLGQPAALPRRAAGARAAVPPGLRPEIEGYVDLQPMGGGGMSRVFLARHPASGTRRVVKTLPLDVDEDLLQRFLQEYALIAQVRHPNVALIHEQGFAPDCAYIAMEHLSGGSLHQRIVRGIGLEEALLLAIQIALGLTTIHDRGIVHRDLKPENLLFRDDGLLVLADFGIARQSSTHLTRTQQGLVYGTPYYMSPEQAAGRAVDARSDLYSLGVILHEMLAGTRPFEASRAEAVAYQQVHSPPPPLPAHAAILQDMQDRLLAKQPAARHGSAAELLTDLRARLTRVRAGRSQPVAEVAGR
jgi:hypothetical protein